MTAQCPHCGHATRPQSRFCPHCGWRVEMRLGPGTLLQGGEYTVVRSISKGGMGAVYLARDRRAFGRLCVVKQMLDYYDPNDAVERRRAQERFEEEGRTLASLSHPGIPRIYAFFQEGGGYYIVMEHIQGENLESFCTRQTENGVVKPTRRLHLEETLRYGMQAAFILEYLHGQSRPVVHQDIKPANLILEGQMGDVRLVDFGTARVRMPEGASPGNGDKASIYGTDGYAPPEQYRGHPVPQSDVFSLAATLYHLLTDDDPRGHPFQWPKLAMLPKELSAAMERALRHDPYKRPSARELRQALEAFVAPHRTLEVFTFPGNHQIRIVAALPVLCDEHWDAARSFLYEGDFKRWLRDINRHDLVVTADGIVQRETNRDRGLEAFLHAVDAGLAAPRLTVDQAVVDLGPVAREAALIRRVTVSNSTRGYTLATVQVSDSWVEVYPQQLHLWAGIPSDIRIQVRADSLPLRSRQLSVVRITADGQDPVEVQVTARVSLTREVARLAWRALSAAVPESWRLLKRAWAFDARLTGTVVRPLAREPRLFWALWFLLGMGAGAALYLPLAWGGGIPLVGRHLAESAPWDIVVVAALLGPLAFSVGLWLAWMALSLLGSALWGAARGAWKSFVR